MLRFRTASAERLPLGADIPVPVGFQVLIGVGILGVLFVASIVIAIFLVVELNATHRELSTRHLPYLREIDNAALSAKSAALDSRGYLISGEPVFLQEFSRSVGEARVALSAATRRATTVDEARAAGAAQSGFDRWLDSARQEFALYNRGDHRAALEDSVGDARAVRKRYEASLAAAARLGSEAIRADEVSYTGASHRAVMVLLVCLLTSLALGLAVAVWVVRKILAPVYAVLTLFADLQPSALTKT